MKILSWSSWCYDRKGGNFAANTKRVFPVALIFLSSVKAREAAYKSCSANVPIDLYLRFVQNVALEVKDGQGHHVFQCMNVMYYLFSYQKSRDDEALIKIVNHSDKRPNEFWS